VMSQKGDDKGLVIDAKLAQRRYFEITLNHHAAGRTGHARDLQGLVAIRAN
jgi:hypothetical protein